MSLFCIIKSKKRDLLNSCRVLRWKKQFLTSTSLVKNTVPPPTSGFPGAAAKRSILSNNSRVSLPSRMNPQRMFCRPTNPPPSSPRTITNWFRRKLPGRRFTLLLLGGSVFLFWSAERIPYTNRFHFAVWEPYAHAVNSLGMDPELLPPTDPTSIKVDAIARDIVQALYSGLRLDSLDHQVTVNGNPLSLDAAADFVQDRKGTRLQNKLWKPHTKHLSSKTDWQVIFTDSDFKCQWCSTRMIAIPKKSLDGLTSDAEIATVIAHAVGHAVARHTAELWILPVSFLIVCLCLVVAFQMVFNLNIIDEDWINGLKSEDDEADDEEIGFFADKFDFQLRNELEADYIGLMLMASAGYDPREAPKVFEKFLPCSPKKDFDPYPLRSKRAEFLNKPEVMEEALAVYNQVKAGSGVQSFI